MRDCEGHSRHMLSTGVNIDRSSRGDANRRAGDHVAEVVLPLCHPRHRNPDGAGVCRQSRFPPELLHQYIRCCKCRGCVPRRERVMASVRPFPRHRIFETLCNYALDDLRLEQRGSDRLGARTPGRQTDCIHRGGCARLDETIAGFCADVEDSSVQAGRADPPHHDRISRVCGGRGCAPRRKREERRFRSEPAEVCRDSRRQSGDRGRSVFRRRLSSGRHPAGKNEQQDERHA